MIKNTIQMLEILKGDTKNLGELTKVALGKNKIPETLKEAINLTLLNYGRKSKN
jgi:hypothetical protein|tara:strand:- start:3051 stop:3212 length:162 start_codon:yes stop_codon:yes gene_type:complete